MEQALDDLSIPPGALAAGTYYIAVSPLNGVTGDYELFAGMEGILETITITGDDLPMILTNSDDERLEFSYTGPGQAALLVERSLITDKIVGTTSLTVTGSTGHSEVSLRNIDNDGNLELQTITLTRSMYSLACGGSVDTLASSGNRNATVRNVTLQDLRTVDAPRFKFQSFTTGNLGDPNATAQVGFDVRSLSELNVHGDIDNVWFFTSDSRNRYDEISVDGVIDTVTFYGDYIRTMNIFNINQEETAMADSGVYLSNYLSEFTVTYGDVNNSVFTAYKKIDHFELVNGNLKGSRLTTNSRSDRITELLVYGDAGDDETPIRGNISACLIAANKMIKYIYAEGQIDSSTQISASSLFSSSLKELSTGGNCAAVINAIRTNEVLIGFDRYGKRKVENETFTGADFTGAEESFKVWRGYAFAKQFADAIERNPEAYKETIRWNTEYGLGLTTTDLGNAAVTRTKLRERVLRFLDEHRFLAIPTSAVPPFPITVEYPDEINGVCSEGRGGRTAALALDRFPIRRHPARVEPAMRSASRPAAWWEARW